MTKQTETPETSSPSPQRWLVSFRDSRLADQKIEAHRVEMDADWIIFSTGGKPVAWIAAEAAAVVGKLKDEPESESEPRMSAVDAQEVGADPAAPIEVVELQFNPATREAIEEHARSTNRTPGMWIAEAVEAEVRRQSDVQPMNVYRVLHRDGSTQTVHAHRLVEYDDGGFSFRVGEETVGLGTRMTDRDGYRSTVSCVLQVA